MKMFSIHKFFLNQGFKPLKIRTLAIDAFFVHLCEKWNTNVPHSSIIWDPHVEIIAFVLLANDVFSSVSVLIQLCPVTVKALTLMTRTTTYWKALQH